MTIHSDDHLLKRPLARAIAGMTDPDEIVAAVMTVLRDFNLVTSRDPDVLPLLSASGRLLIDLTRYPNSTLREASVRLGTTENNVQAQMTKLVRAGLIERTRIGTRNRYKMRAQNVLAHTDSATFLEALLITAGRADAKN